MSLLNKILGDYMNDLISDIKSYFAAKPNITYLHDINYLGISWDIAPNDKGCTKSKTIKIQVTSEAQRDYRKNQHYQKILAYLACRMKSFDPQHGTPQYEAPPVHDFGVINTNVLDGIEK